MDEREVTLRKRLAKRLFTMLSDKALAEFLYEAVQGRKTGSGCGHFVLAAAYARPDGTVDEVCLVGPHHAPSYPQGWADEALICQFGKCSTCRSSVVSWAKQAVCPACGERTYCT